MGENKIGIESEGTFKCSLRRLVSWLRAKFLKEAVAPPQARPGRREARILFDAGYVYVACQRHVVQRSMTTKLVCHEIQLVGLRFPGGAFGRRCCTRPSGSACKAEDNKMHHSLVQRQQFANLNV